MPLVYFRRKKMCQPENKIILMLETLVGSYHNDREKILTAPIFDIMSGMGHT